MATYIDPSPSIIATRQLQAIPFGTLIGAPLDAAIRAQANAAISTVDFIRAVGLQENAEGQLEAITVTFSYQESSTGVTKNLIVPLLAILPLPLIAIDDINIEFKANISAEAAMSESTTLSTAFSADTKVSVRWWFVRADFSASYSSKKDSTATRNSKYSVEYTMDVSVHASQADPPEGLSRVLNILETAVATRDQQGTVIASGTQDSLMAKGDSLSFNIMTLNGESKPVQVSTTDLKVSSSNDTLVKPDSDDASTNKYGSGTVSVTADGDPPDSTERVDITVTWTIEQDVEATAVFPVYYG